MMGQRPRQRKYWTPGSHSVAESGQYFEVLSSLLPLQKALKENMAMIPKMHHTIKHKH